MQDFGLKKESFPKIVLEVCQLLVNHGKQSFIVGGSIRDIIFSRERIKDDSKVYDRISEPNDWDIATNATPHEVMKIFGKKFRVIPTGIKHGTVTILNKKLNIEVTSFRLESDYIDGRRPSKVSFVDDITTDLSRRDLTINAIAYDPIHDKFVDPFNGLKDIDNKIIRMVGDPDDRLEEDGLRLIRIFRFASQFGFKIEQKTLDAIPRHFETFSRVSEERIHSELQKLLKGAYWKNSLHALIECKVLHKIVNEFNHETITQVIPDVNMDRMALTARILSELPTKPSLRLQYAVIFHQLSTIASTSTRCFPKLNRELIENILKRLKFPNKQINEILHLLKIHLIPLPYSSENPDEFKNYSIRKFQHRIKSDYLKDYLDFFLAKMQILQKRELLTEELYKDILNRANCQRPIELRDLAISGDDVHHYFKLDKSQASQREFIGLCLRIIRERVEVEPQINKKEAIFLILENLNRIVSQCKTNVTRYARIVSTDHIRKIYQNNSPIYSSWESTHTYELAFWLNLCLLRKKRPYIVIFDGTNFNMPNHPYHRKSLCQRFKKFNPLFINVVATDKEVMKNLEYRERERPSIRKSDADLKIYERYRKLIQSYPNALSLPEGCRMVKISTHDSNFEQRVQEIIQNIIQNGHRFIVLSGNVLTGKTYTAQLIQKYLDEFESSGNIT
ncbi:MAG: CCA tRNA nucleotidyltransferase [Candidatus Hodarchaeota archaeon]